MSYKEQDGALAIDALLDFHLQAKPIEFDLLRKADAIAWAYKIPIYDASM